MKQKGFYSSILYLTSTFFTPISLLLNILCAVIVAPEKLAPLYSIYLILISCLLVSCVILIIKDEPPKLLNNNTYCRFVLLFTLISVFLNTFVYMFKANFVWNIYSILLSLIFSLILSFCIGFVRFKNIALYFVFYFVIIGIFYYTLSIAIAGFGAGNKLVIVIFSYIGIYIVAMIAILIIRSKIQTKKLNAKPYQKKF